MKITIESIEAEGVNTSTFEGNDFIIDHWTVKYEILIEEGHSVRGTLKWTAVPIVYKIIKYIKWFYGKRNTTTPQPS